MRFYFILILLQVLKFHVTNGQGLVRFGQLDSFKFLSDDNITRTYDHFAGELSAPHCKAYCLMKRFKYAGHDEDSFCWCGNTFSAGGCSEDKWCMEVYKAFIDDLPEMTLPDHPIFHLFSQIIVEMNLNDGTEYGVVKDKKLEIHPSNKANTTLVKTETKIKMEYEAFWGAGTSEKVVKAYIKPWSTVFCPDEVGQNEEVCCYLHMVGTKLKEVTFTFNGNERTKYETPSESTILTFGGNMETNRFEEYMDSHDTNVAFININNEFTVEGFIRAFEAYITRTGEITFMVLKPGCFNADQQYDNYEKKCIAKDSKPDICSDLNTYCAPDGKPTFCMENNRFGEAGDYVCKNAPAMDNVEIDFEIIFAYTVTADRLGTMTFLPSHHAHVIPGYILGWGGTGDSPGDIAYYAIDPEYEGIQRRFRYENITKFVTGGFLPQGYKNPSTENYRELIEATVVTQVIYEECFNATGGPSTKYDMETVVSSAIGTFLSKSSARVYVSEPIRDLATKKTHYTIGLNEKLDFSTQITATTGLNTMTTCVRWGDEEPSQTPDKCTDSVTNVAQLRHTYTVPGEYTITITAKNHYNTTTIQAQVTVTGVVNEVRYVDHYKHLPPIKIKDNIDYCFIVDGNGLGNVSIDCKSENIISPGMTPANFQMDMAPFSLVCFSTPTSLADLHCCSVGAKDAVNMESADECIHVQQVIKGLTFNKVIATTNEEVVLSVNDSMVGTNRTIKWTSQQNQLNKLTMPYVHNTTHIFTARGWNNVSAFAYNQVSSETTSILIFVEDRITGISFLETPFHTAFEESTKVYAAIKEGSAMDCKIFYNSNNKTDELFVSRLGVKNKLYIFSEYVFSDTGHKTVVANCSNNNTYFTNQTDFYVQRKVLNATLNLIQQFEGENRNDIEINETVYLNISTLQGDDLVYSVNWGNGYNVTQKTSNFSNSYPYPKTFQITVNISNMISYQVLFLEIEVKTAVVIIKGLQILSGPASTAEIHQMQLAVDSGDYFTCDWKIDDGDCERCSFEQSYTDFLKKRGFVKFHFREDRKYIVCVSCENRLYEADTCTDIYAYDPISLVSLYVFSHLPYDPRGEAKGERNNLYDYDFPVLVETTIETGTNVTVHYDFGYSYENGTRATAIEYPLSNTTHKFLLSEDRNMDTEYKITAIVRNAISKGEVIFDNNRNVKKIKLISAVKPDFSISSGKNNVSILQFTTNFSITFYSLPYRPCCLLDPGEIKDGKTYYFGGEECSTHYGLAQFVKTLEIEEGQPIELFRYYYKKENFYKATVQCRNDLTVFQRSIGVNVLDYPCGKPKLGWEVPLSVSSKKPNVIKKCNRENFRITLEMNCQKLNISVKYTWLSKMVFDRNDGIVEDSDHQPITGLNKTFEIKARTLQYGTYMLLVNATMMQRKDNVTINPVADTTATLFGYFKVIPCKLIGKFKGGGGKAAYQKSNLTIDASECEDPNEQGGGRNKLKFNWGCFSDKDNITADDILKNDNYVTYPKTGPHHDTQLNETLQSGTFKGCFGNEPGLLYGGGIWNIAAKDMLNLQLRYFIPNKTYTVFLHIKYISPSEGTNTLTLYYRLTVTSESVPDVALVDTTNSGPRINPTFKKKYLAKCYNCEDYDESVIIDWKISLLEGETAIDVTQDMKQYLRYRVSHNGARLIVREHGFSAYAGLQLVQVKVEFRYKKATSNTTYGYSVIVFTVNAPPDVTNAKCNVYPFEGGQSLRTKFHISVEDVIDTDLPLKFMFSYEKGQNFVDIGFKKGSKVSDEFVLPSGVTQIDVVAIDKEEVKSKQFSCPANVEEMKISKDAMFSILDSSLGNGNAQQLSNQVNSMLDVMSDDKDFKQDDFDDIISHIIKSVSKTEVNSKESAIAMSDIMIKTIPEAGLKSMDEVDSMVSSLKKVYSIPWGDFTPDEQVNQLNTLFDASASISKNIHGNTSDETMNYILESEAALAGQQAATLQPGEITLVSTLAENITIECIEISYNRNDSITVDDFILPYACIEDAICERLKREKEKDEDFYFPEDCIPRDILGPCLRSKFSIGVNRFNYDTEGASHIYESVVNLHLYDNVGKSFTIDKCNKTITFSMKNSQEEIQINQTFVAYTDLWLQYHEIEIQYNHTSMFVTVKPVNNTFTGHFAVYFGKDFQPNVDKPDYVCILPKNTPSDFHTWETYKQKEWDNEKKWRCHLAQHRVGQKTKGRWLIGVLYIPEENVHQKKKKRDVSWNEDEIMLPKQLKSRGDLLSDDEEKDFKHKVEYSFQAYTRSCQKRGDMAWDSEGVTVSDDTVKKQTICQTVKLAVFGGGGPFAPNKPIDFTKPFREFDDVGENAIVFAIVISFLVLYLLMLLWARRKDLIDLEKRKIAELSDNHPDDKCFYEIYVQTGAFSGSSTSADVFITINGDEAESAPRQLKNPVRECFQRNYTDVFLMSSPYTLGSLTSLKIWHNNKGYSPGWFLSQVQVHCLETRQKYLFVCDEWLDVAESDHKIIRKLDVIDKEDLSDFEYIFTQASRKNFYDGHIWLSLFTRPVQSNFSAVQRLTTIFATILMMMLANAMFYTGDERPPTDSIRLAYFYVSFSEVKIGLIAALIVLPAVFLIIMLYRYAGPRSFKDAERYKVSIEEALLLQAERGNDLHNRIYKQRTWLPCWLIYIAYILCYVLMAVCAFFTIHIGFKYGKTKADQWIVSLMLSFLHSIIILWPLMVVTYSAISTAAVKQSPDIEEVDECQRIIIRSKDEESMDTSNSVEAMRAKLNIYKLPDENRLEEYRVQRFKDKRIKTILNEIFVHLSFVVLCLMVCYAAVDPNAQRLYQSAHDLIGMNGITNSYFEGKTYQSDDRDADGKNKKVQTAPDITNRAEWFDWARYSLIEYLFPTGWYNQKQTNNKFPYKSGFIADSASSKVLAMARFRQLRLKDEDTCTKHEVFEHLITQCNGPYSYANQQNKSFNIGWKTFNQTSNEIDRIGKRPTLWRGLESPWKYSTMDELQNFDFFGRFATYDGASYSVSIGPKKRIAKKLLYSMKDFFWIDRRTRAIFAEANVYNANANLLLLITFLHEILPTGGWNYYPNVQVIRLYRYVDDFGKLIIFFDIAFIIVTFYGLYKIIKSCKNLGCKAYMTNVWNILHVIVTSCSITAFLINCVRVVEVKYKIIQYTENPTEFISFTLVSLLENLTIACLGFVLFFTNLEFLRILRFNHQIALMSKTMSILGAPLGSFGMTFFVIFMAYVSLSHCLFVDKLEDFRTPMETLVSLARMFMGQFNINDYFDNAPYLGPILFFTYMISVQMVMINLFVGLICDAYAESGCSDDDSESGEKPNLISFVKSQVQNIGKNGGPIVDPIYSDWKDEWEVMLDSFHDRCENCVFVMRNIESEEIRQLKFFEEDVDEKKKNVLMSIVGVDYFQYDSELSDGLVVLEKRIKEMNKTEANVFRANAAFRKLDFAADKQSIASESSSGEESSEEEESEDDAENEDMVQEL